MTEVSKLPAGTYVLAVSGGVDSVVLLDMLARQPQFQLIVTHVDHGIREDSSQDAVFVQQLAKKYGCRYELKQLHLGARTSEEHARHERYRFLQAVQQRYNAQAIITAHHADDVIETVLINLLRGTGWRGLCSLRSHGSYMRPLLAVGKQELLAYAKRHHLSWREDSTNQATNYLRNYVRLQLLPSLVAKRPSLKNELYDMWRKQCRLREQIETQVAELYQFVADETGLRRRRFAECEPNIADEILRYFLQVRGVRQTGPQRARALAFIASAGNAKKFSLNANAFLQLRRNHIIVVPVKN